MSFALQRSIFLFLWGWVCNSDNLPTEVGISHHSNSLARIYESSNGPTSKGSLGMLNSPISFPSRDLMNMKIIHLKNSLKSDNAFTTSNDVDE